MALQSSGAISIADINTEIGGSSTSQMSFQTAGETFELDVNATNWSDSNVGLGMDEFYGLDIDDIYGNNMPSCLLNDMLVQHQQKGRVRVYDLEVGDVIRDRYKWTKITGILKDHARSGYWLLDEWVKITDDHPIWSKEDKWHLPKKHTGKKQYIPVASNTVYIRTDSKSFNVYGEQNQIMTVSGDYSDVLD